jgi:hypothetical protein
MDKAKKYNIPEDLLKYYPKNWQENFNLDDPEERKWLKELAEKRKKYLEPTWRGAIRRFLNKYFKWLKPLP